MVNQCICYKTTFQELKNLMDSGLSLKEVIDKTNAGRGCGMCIPYIKLTVKNGNTSHQPDDIETYKNLIEEFDEGEL